MNKNRQYSPFRIGLDLWMARIGRVIAWAGIILWTMLAIAGFSMLFGEKTHETPAD